MADRWMPSDRRSTVTVRLFQLGWIDTAIAVAGHDPSFLQPFAVCCCVAACGVAGRCGRRPQAATPGSGASDGFLKPDQAFVLTAESESADRVTLRWQIAKDYYLYRDKIAVPTRARTRSSAPRSCRRARPNTTNTSANRSSITTNWSRTCRSPALER